MPPKGWKKGQGDRDKSQSISWHRDFVSFGDRLNFLSPERQHLNTGKLRILPPRDPEKRNGRTNQS